MSIGSYRDHAGIPYDKDPHAFSHLAALSIFRVGLWVLSPQKYTRGIPKVPRGRAVLLYFSDQRHSQETVLIKSSAQFIIAHQL